jgi:hypothetical protein
MRRLNFLIPDTQLTHTIVTEMQQLGIPRSNLHVIAAITKNLKGLPTASIWQKTELARGLILGLVLGALAGFTGGLLVVAFPPGGVPLGPQVLAIGGAAGAFVGAAMLGLMKGNEHNHDIDQYKKEIEHGEILLMVDVPKADIDVTIDNILRHHPEALIKVSEPK